MKVFVVEGLERTGVEVPLVGVVGVEGEIRILAFVRLLEHGVLEAVALAEGAVAVIVVVHPLIHGS